METVFGEKGKMFLENLPDLIEDASTRWGLTDIQTVSKLSFHFVAFAKRNNEDVILKLGIPSSEPELISEMAALKLFNGNGACQLLECDEEHGFLLLERLRPGVMLSELEDDDERTHIAADVMQRMESTSLLANLRELAPALQNKFIKLSDWFDALKRIRPHFNGGTGPFPKEVLERVESFLPELFSDKDVRLLHGDFHHFNILSSDRGWLVIDPKGVIGPVGYEVGPLMINPWDSISDGSMFKVRAERRVSILSERLGWEREKIIKWSTAHAVLSSWWSMEDGAGEEDTSWEYSMWCAKIFSELK
jgi:streptomycin 6-kinase